MTKLNYVKVSTTSDGWRFKEFYWETVGHFWNIKYTSPTYDTLASAVSQAKSYADTNDLEYVE